MNIFELLDSVAFTKKPLDDINFETDNTVNLFMVNRWTSMIDPVAARLINDTTNRFHNVFANKNDAFRLIQTILPNYSKRRIHYIKKPVTG